MLSYEIIKRKPTPEELEGLRKAVNWGLLDRAAAEIGLENSLFGVCIVIEGEVIGAARVVGDAKTCFYIQDVIVHPMYQKNGIGKELLNNVMEYISENAAIGAVVGLMAAKGKEEFYEKYGFWKRPNEHFGYGMMQFWGK